MKKLIAVLICWAFAMLIGNAAFAEDEDLILKNHQDWIKKVQAVNHAKTVKSEALSNDKQESAGSAELMLGDANGDGVVNAYDLSVVIGNYGHEADWGQGDFNGDGIVNADDLNMVLQNYEGQKLPGDTNGDGKVNFYDLGIVIGNYGTNGDWGQGDFNGDGIINADDLNVLLQNYEGQELSGDADGDGKVNHLDLEIWKATAGLTADSEKWDDRADFNKDGAIDGLDLDIWKANYVPIPGDANRDGKVNLLDLDIFKESAGATPGSDAYNENADFNGDGFVDGLDLDILKAHLGESEFPPEPAPAGNDGELVQRKAVETQVALKGNGANYTVSPQMADAPKENVALQEKK